MAAVITADALEDSYIKLQNIARDTFSRLIDNTNDEHDRLLKNAGITPLNKKYAPIENWDVIAGPLKDQMLLKYETGALDSQGGVLNGSTLVSEELGSILGLPTANQVLVPNGTCHPGGFVADRYGNAHHIKFRYGKAVYKMWGMLLELPTEIRNPNIQFHTTGKDEFVRLVTNKRDLSPCADMSSCDLSTICGVVKGRKRRTRC